MYIITIYNLVCKFTIVMLPCCSGNKVKGHFQKTNCLCKPFVRSKVVLRSKEMAVSQGYL